MSTEIGKIIKQRREELGMTQEELARKLNYKSKSTINKIESGINDVPRTKIIYFANALELSPSDLMGWSSDEKYKHKVHALDLEAFLLNNTKYIIMCISNVLKNERINKDLTEKSVALNAGVTLEEYLILENDYVNIGAVKIENIIQVLDINFDLLHGMLIAFSIIFKSIDGSEGTESDKTYSKEVYAKKCIMDSNENKKANKMRDDIKSLR